MPISLTYPGVYVQEIASGVRTITGVATSITAFIGRAARGPTNQPVSINSYADFERLFGGLWNQSYLGFAVRDFYMNGGSQAIIVRLYEPDNGSGPNPVVVPSTAHLSLPVDKTHELLLEAADEGAWSNNLIAMVDHNILQGQYGLAISDLFNLTVIDTVNGVSEQYNNVSVKDSPGRIDKVLQNQSRLVRAINTATNPLPAAIPAVTVTPIGVKARVVLGASTQALVLQSVNTLANATDLHVSVHHYDTTNNAAVTKAADYGLALTDLFGLTITSTAGAPVTLDFLTVKDPTKAVSESPRVDIKLQAQSTKLAQVITLPTVIPDATTADVNASLPVIAGDGLALKAATVMGSANAKTGLYALEKADLFNLLCIPPYDDTGTDIDGTIRTAATQYCEQRRAFFILDAPSNWTSKDAAKNGLTGLNITSNHAAVFFPRIQQPNPLQNNQLQTFVPCGAVAGTMARIDAQRGLWKAPAGMEASINGITQFSVPLTDAEIGELNPLGINCLRALPAAGPVIWGARTRQGDDRLASEWKYIPVRRLALYIEESLYRGTQWAVFEPNDEPLWSQIRLNVGSFMNQLFRQGAFQGAMPQEAYFVKCDKDTTTQADINAGVVNILVGFAPLKPAEFVVISIQQIAGSIQA